MSDQLFADDVAAARRVTLVRLSGEIARAVNDLGMISVEGEVHRAKPWPNGRIYFTLRDRVAQVSVVCPQSRADRCRVVDGERVLVTGRLEWNTDRGQLQLKAEEVAPVGDGAVAAAIAEARAALDADGLLDRPRFSLPVLPRTVGVICGTEAAVRADILSIRSVRFAGYPMRIEEVVVSGPGAVDSMIDALGRLSHDDDVDVIVFARGGGDATQLLPFSDETLCRAVASCGKPTVAAIGHEEDRPLLDEVVDLRCGTPSIAAAAVIPNQIELEVTLKRHGERFARALLTRRDESIARLARIDHTRSLRNGLRLAQYRYDQSVSRLRVLTPSRRVHDARHRLSRLDLTSVLRSRHHGATDRWVAGVRHVDALSPQHVLDRGYAVVRSRNGVVRANTDVHTGTSIEVQLAKGNLTARVEDNHE